MPGDDGTPGGGPDPTARLPRPRDGLTLMTTGGALTAAAVIWFALRWWRPVGPPILGWLAVPMVPLLAIVATERVVGRADLPLPARRFWRHLSVGAGILTLSVFTSAYDSLAGPGAPVRNTGPVTTVLFVLSTLTLLRAVSQLPLFGRSRAEWLTIGPDVGIVLVAITLILWRVLASNDVDGNSVEDVVVWTSVAVLAVVSLLSAMRTDLTNSSGIDHRALWILIGTIGVGGVAGASYPLLAGRPDLSTLMPSLPMIYLGVMIAANAQYRAPVAGRPHRHRGRPAVNVVPYVAIACISAPLLSMARDLPTRTQLMIVGSLALTALVIVRQLVALRDNARLLAQVDANLLTMRRTERRFESMVQNSEDVISIADATGHLLYLSPAATRVLGVPADELLVAGSHPRVHPDDLPTITALFKQLHGRPNHSVRTQARVRHADGSWLWFDVTYRNLLHDPSVRGIVVNYRDITDIRRYQDQLSYQATHDELTGLGNRSLFISRTEQALAAGPPGTVAVALVDLDDFKNVNDQLGHAIGDALLIAVGGRLRDCLRQQDTVVRIGGDEFAVLFVRVPVGGSGPLAERIIAALSAPVSAAGHDLLIQASVGLADSQAGTTAEDLLRRTHLAMYEAKELGRNRYVRYDAEFDARTTAHAELAAELSQALRGNELHLLYQPIVDLSTGRLAGVEALLRWDHPRDGLLSPLRFIPVAERTGLIVPIGAWVLGTACAQAAEWYRRHGAGTPDRISVNVSARQLLDPTFPAVVAKVLAETGLDPGRLTIEITETSVFGGGRAVETVSAIHALGVQIALDDFGTGHSSLGLLRTCPVDVLKVDKSFVDEVTGTVEQAAIARAIIEIAQALGMRAIAEGVETKDQADRLHSLGYRFAQGFYFAEPMRAVALEALFTVAGNAYEPATA